MSMTTPKAILIGATMISAAVIVLLFLGDRYQIAQSSPTTAWKIDKIRGTMWLCSGSGECRRIPN
jgi:hypothetical protein